MKEALTIKVNDLKEALRGLLSQARNFKRDISLVYPSENN